MTTPFLETSSNTQKLIKIVFQGIPGDGYEEDRDNRRDDARINVLLLPEIHRDKQGEVRPLHLPGAHSLLHKLRGVQEQPPRLGGAQGDTHKGREGPRAGRGRDHLPVGEHPTHSLPGGSGGRERPHGEHNRRPHRRNEKAGRWEGSSPRHENNYDGRLLQERPEKRWL